MINRHARSTPNSIYKISSRGPTCLVACRDARLALTLARALEDQHYPFVLVPSAPGFQQPLLLQPDVVILDEPMAHELDAIGSREIKTYISLRPLVLLSADFSGNAERDWLRPHAVLPVSTSSSEIVQTVYTLAQAEPAEGGQHAAVAPGQVYYPTPSIPAVS
jgi:hypothetical protein